MRKKNIILTGATGFIGRYLARELFKKNYNIYLIVRNRQQIELWQDYKNYNVIECELSRLDKKFFPEGIYDAFIHLAWGGVNRDEIDDPKVHLNNYKNSLCCLQAAYDLKCRLFADTGSRAEYGKISGLCREELSCEPENAYGKEKLRFYQYAYTFCKQHGMEYIHFRLFSVIGVDDHPWSLVSTACKNFLLGNPMRMGSCRQLWNFMSVRDVANAMIQCVQESSKLPEDDNDIINVASTDTRVLRDFIMEIHRLAQSTSDMIFDDQVKGYDSNPSVDKLGIHIGWKDHISFEDEIKNILDHLRTELL